MQIQGLSHADELLLMFEEAKEYFVPTRCPLCESTNIADAMCTGGSVCGYACGGSGFRVFCNDCGKTINEAECDEAEEE